MNTSRWLMAHQMMLELERREIRRWARFCGTDMDVVENEEVVDPKFGEHPRVLPIAALLNPESYKNLMEADHAGIEASIPDDVYEQQVEALDAAGMLTDIDMLGEEAEKKIKQKKLEKLDKLFPMVDEPHSKK